MKSKKSKAADINRNIKTWMMMGLTVTLSLLLVSFEWKQFTEIEDMSYNTIEDIAIEEVILAPPLKPKPKRTTAVKPSKKEQVNFNELIEELDYKPEVKNDIFIDSLAIVDDPVEIFNEPTIEMPTAFPDVKAAFPGGDQALLDFLGKEIDYPEIGLSMGLEEKVYLRFVVKKTGEIAEITSLKETMVDFEKEAIRALSNSPMWKPGIKDGQVVDSYFYLPVNFSLK